MAVERSIEEKGPSPFALMRRLSDDMERMFEDTWGTHRLPKLLRRLDLATTR